jgi:hypothetical protein
VGGRGRFNTPSRRTGLRAREFVGRGGSVSCASWLRRTHRRYSVFVDFNYISSGICAAREAFEAFRGSRNDRVGASAGLDDVTLFEFLIEERVERIRASTQWIDLTHEASFGA